MHHSSWRPVGSCSGGTCRPVLSLAGDIAIRSTMATCAARRTHVFVSARTLSRVHTGAELIIFANAAAARLAPPLCVPHSLCLGHRIRLPVQRPFAPTLAGTCTFTTFSAASITFG